MKRLLGMLLAFVMVFSLPFQALAEEDSGKNDGNQWINSSLPDAMDESTPTDLKDDFYLAVNRDWIAGAEIPAGYSEFGSFTEISLDVMDKQIALMTDESLSGHDAELVRKMYGLVSDWDARNELGIEPAVPYVDAVKALATFEDCNAFLSSEEANPFYIAPISTSVDVDLSDPNRYIVMVGAPGLMLMDSAEYTNRTANGDMYYEINSRIYKMLLEKFGATAEEAETIFQNAFDFEALLAEHIKAVATHYEADYLSSVMNYYTRTELEELAGSFPVLPILDMKGIGGSESFLVDEPDFFTGLQEIWKEENTPLIRDWLLVQAVSTLADVLDRDTYDAMTSISNEVRGVSGVISDEEINYQYVSSLLSVPMDNLYIQAYCTEQMRDDIRSIIHEVVAEYHEILSGAEWLSAETREKAVEKLDSLRINAVYPDELGDSSDLDFASKEDGGTLLDALLAVRKFNLAKMRAKVNGKVDKDKWEQEMMPTAMVNAFYNPQNNSINILAGILSDPFYDVNMTEEEMFGGIGVVIGHEISHAFDTTGAQFDKDGAFNNWWTEADYTAFRERAAKLAAYYSSIIPYEGGTYNGEQVQGEAIADMGGLKCMLGIAESHEGFDYDTFFRQFAKIWRSKELESYMIMRVAQDSHPLNYLRTNVTLQQFDEFLKTYEIQEGDGMYLAPEDRILVW